MCHNKVYHSARGAVTHLGSRHVARLTVVSYPLVDQHTPRFNAPGEGVFLHLTKQPLAREWSRVGVFRVMVPGMMDSFPGDRAEFRIAFRSATSTPWLTASIADLYDKNGWAVVMQDRSCWLIASGEKLQPNSDRHGKRIGPIHRIWFMTRHVRFWQIDPRSSVKSTSVRLLFPRAIVRGRRVGEYGHLKVVELST